MELLKTNRRIQCLFVILLSGVTFAVNITFQVDMANENIHAEGVHIWGSMQGFDPSASVLMDEEMREWPIELIDCYAEIVGGNSYLITESMIQVITGEDPITFFDPFIPDLIICMGDSFSENENENWLD